MEKKIDTKALASLSKLSFSKDESESFQRDMESIQRFFEKVSQAALCSALSEEKRENVLREDVPMSFKEHEELVSLSKSRGKEGFEVPKVVEE